MQGNFIEFENLLGEPLREGKRAGVPMPTLEVLYQLARTIQWRTKEARGWLSCQASRLLTFCYVENTYYSGLIP